MICESILSLMSLDRHELRYRLILRSMMLNFAFYVLIEIGLSVFGLLIGIKIPIASNIHFTSNCKRGSHRSIIFRLD